MARTSRAAAILLASALALGGARAAMSEEAKGVSLSAEELRWREMSAKAPGVMISEVRGESAAGPWSGFVRFPAGSKSAVHRHSSDMTVVIVKGTWRYGPSTEKEKSYGPGSFVFIPAELPHSNSQPEEVLMFVEQSGRFDNKPVATAAR
ncbi:MAG TPA: DUF4437 domain-containing protein [Myxococcaceae bacterium]